MPRHCFRTLSFLIASAVAATAQTADPGEPTSSQTPDSGAGPAASAARRFEVLHLAPGGAIGIRMISREPPSGEQVGIATGGAPEWIFSLRPARPVLVGDDPDRELGVIESVDGSDPAVTADLFPGDGEGVPGGPCWIECYTGLAGIPLGDPLDREILWRGEAAVWIDAWNDERRMVLDVVARWNGGGNEDDQRALARLDALRRFATPMDLRYVWKQERSAAVDEQLHDRNRKGESIAVVEKRSIKNPSLPAPDPAADPVEPSSPDDEKPPSEEPPLPNVSDEIPPEDGSAPPEATEENHSVPPGVSEENLPADDEASRARTGSSVTTEPSRDSPSGPIDASAYSEPMQKFIARFRRETLASLALAAEALAHASTLPHSGSAPATDPAAESTGARDWKLLGEACRALMAEDKDLKALAESLSLPALWEPPADWPACEQRARKIRLQLERGS